MGPVGLLDALVSLGPGRLELGFQLVDAHLQRGQLAAQLKDAANPLEVDALLL